MRRLYEGAWSMAPVYDYVNLMIQVNKSSLGFRAYLP